MSVSGATAPRRRGGRGRSRGRSLGGLPAAELVARAGEAASLNDWLAAHGFVLSRAARGCLRRDGFVSVRFVWRRRVDQRTVTMSMRFPATLAGGRLTVHADHGSVISQRWGWRWTITEVEE